ncbi:Neurogenic locus notch protein 3 [Elasticomyces elasticus]|nr:Neurogenic locus notch protein 3 [Elasticomyces elasticus]
MLSSIRPAGLLSEGLPPIDEEDGMQPSAAQSSEDEGTAVGAQLQFTCERCLQGFKEKKTLTRHQKQTKRCADAGFDSRAERCECCDPPNSFARPDTRRLHETRKRRRTQRTNPIAATRHDQSTEASCSAGDQCDGQAEGSSSIVSQSMYGRGHACLEDERGHEIDETVHPGLQRGFVSASGTECGPRSRSSSSEGHDSGIELQPGILDERPASSYMHLQVGYTPVADIAMPFVPIAEQISPQATTNEPMDQGNVEMLDDILQYDWQQDPEGYLGLVDLDALAGTQVVSLDDDDTMVWKHEPDNADDRPTTSTSDAVSVRSTSSRRSIISIPGRFLASVIRYPSSTPRGRNTMTLKAQRCSDCKQPYEQDVISLRAHLSHHLDAFRAEGTVPTCDICEIGFVTQRDLDWHLHSAKRAQPSQCCGLPAGHGQPCKGYRCGFDFKHDRPCNGHHPPSDGGLAWTDYDRFKFGQFLRKWELNQVRVVGREAKTVEHLRSFKFAFDNLSLPEFRRLSRLSGISKLSWRSEPVVKAFDMHDLQDSLENMPLNGLLQRTARRLAGVQRTVDNDLLNAASANDIDSVLSLLRRGATPGPALSIAIEQDNSEMIMVLLQAGARVELGLLYQAVSAGQALVAKQLLNHRSCSFVSSHGVVLLQLAIRSASQDTLLAMLSFVDRTAVDQKPTVDQLEEYTTDRDRLLAKRGTNVYFPACPDLTHDPAICVATCLGYDWAITRLLDTGANPDAEGVNGTALGHAIMQRPDCVASLISGKTKWEQTNTRHLKYEKCWKELELDAIQLAVSVSAFSVVEMLLNHCGRVKDSVCGHGKRALLAYLTAPSATLLAILVASRVNINEPIDDFGGLALHYAARGEHMDDAVLAGLLHAGAELCRQDNHGRTALGHAIRTRNTRATILLLAAHGVQLTKTYHTLLFENRKCFNSIEDPVIIDTLFACGFDANAVDAQGHSPLYHACQRARTTAVEALLRAGANPTVQDLCEMMCRQPKLNAAPLLRSLFAYGYPVLESKGEDGRSILHYAAANKDIESILVLGVADSYASRGKLDGLQTEPARTLVKARYLYCQPTTNMSTAVLDVLCFELTAGKRRSAHEFCIGEVELRRSLSTHFAVCEALLRFQPPGLAIDFSSEAIMAIIRSGRRELYELDVSDQFIKLLLQKSLSNLTPEMTFRLVVHAIAYSSNAHNREETIRLLLGACERSMTPTMTMEIFQSTFDKSIDVGTLLFQQCDCKAELSSLCEELLQSPPRDSSRPGYAEMELKGRAALMQCMASERLYIPPLRWCQRGSHDGQVVYTVLKNCLESPEPVLSHKGATKEASPDCGTLDPTQVAFRFWLV